MIRKSTFLRTGMALTFAVGLQIAAQAQDIHFTQFTASPLIVNPAFTGDYTGLYRVTTIYRSQWASVTTPFVTYGASFDMDLFGMRKSDYTTRYGVLSAGAQLFNDKAGDGNLTNFSALGSLAYHKYLGNGSKILGVGLQAGYSEKSLDVSKLYFGDEFNNGHFNSGQSAEYPYMNNKVRFWTINAGASFAQRVNSNFGYQIGIGGNNLNQPQESFEKKKNSDVGLGMRYTGQIGAIMQLSERISVQPAFLYQTQTAATEMIGGTDFGYTVGGDPYIPSFATVVFVGAWYRTGDAAMLTTGLQYKGFRFGLSYDYNISDLKTASNGSGGFEISLTYKAPNRFNFISPFSYPCSRF
jgi:type IX secretion system PorP/SprF family membrane protein